MKLPQTPFWLFASLLLKAECIYIWACRTDVVLKLLILIVDQKSKFESLHVTGIASLISWV